MAEFLSSEEENLFSSSNLHSVTSTDNMKQISSIQSSVTKDTPNSEEIGKTPASKDKDIYDLVTPNSDNFLRSNFQNALDEQSPDSPEPQSEAVTETDEERRLREERESEALAWELMQQESMELYNLQMQFIQENAHALSQDDYQAMQMIINEAGRPVQRASRRPRRQAAPSEEDGTGSQEDVEGAETESYVSEEVEDEVEYDDGEEEEDMEEEQDDDPDNWDYERLLALGQVIGGKCTHPLPVFKMSLCY